MTDGQIVRLPVGPPPEVIAALCTSEQASASQVEHLKSEVALLRADLAEIQATSALEDEYFAAGEFASLLERQIVVHVWPGAERSLSPVKFVNHLEKFFDYFKDGILKPGSAIPESFNTAPEPYGALIAGDGNAFTNIYSRWALLKKSCPGFIVAIKTLKDIRGKVAHVSRRRRGATASSLIESLEKAHVTFRKSLPAGDDSLFPEANEAVEALRCIASLNAPFELVAAGSGGLAGGRGATD